MTAIVDLQYSKTRDRRMSSVNFRGQDIFATKNLYEKLTKFSNFTRFFARKMPEISYNNCPKNIFPIFFLGGGARVGARGGLPSPTSMILVVLKAILKMFFASPLVVCLFTSFEYYYLRQGVL